MRRASLLPMALCTILLSSSPTTAEPLIWGIQAEELEYRLGARTDVLAWELDALAGTDELLFTWRSRGEYETATSAFETLENQLRLETPISDFFNLAAGVRIDTPRGQDRAYGVIGVHGLAPQWFEVDADLFLSDHPLFRIDVEYEALITNRIILTPSFELEVPLADDEAIGYGAWGPKLEIGARLSYDLVDRAVAPYVGVHYERRFGESASLARAEDEDPGGVFFVVGVRLLF